MGIVIFLLVVIALLLSEPQKNRPATLGKLLLMGLLIWFLIQFRILETVLGLAEGLMAVAWQNRATTIYVLGGLFFAWCIGYFFIYAFIRDQIENRAIRREWQESDGAERTRFNQRVEEYMRLGWDRERAERVTANIANPESKKFDLDGHSQSQAITSV